MNKNHLLMGQGFSDVQFFSTTYELIRFLGFRYRSLLLAKTGWLKTECFNYYVHFFFSQLENHFLGGFNSISKKNRNKLNNPKNNALREVSTKTGSSDTTTITVKDIFSPNLSYLQSNFSTIFGSAYLLYADLTDRKDLSSLKFGRSKRLSKNFTVNVELDVELNINLKALPAISHKGDY